MESAYRNPDVPLFAPRVQVPPENPSGHAVLFYREENFLLSELSQFIGSALCSGDSAIMIGTQEHRDGLADLLYRRGLDVCELIQSGNYVEVDAAEALTELLVDDAPDRGRFEILIDALMGEINRTARSNGPVTIYSEMAVLLLQKGKKNEAIRLEQLWNEAAETRSISLCCAYSLVSFPGLEDGEAFHKICTNHTAVIPGEGYSQLSRIDDRLRSVACLQQKSQALESETKLRHREERFRKLIEAVQDYAIYTLDMHGYVATWNAGAKHILGYEETEILGQHFSCFFSEVDVLARKPMLELQIASNEGRFEEEGWRLRKDGSKLFASVALTAVRDDDGATIGYSAVTRDITNRMLGQDAFGEVRDGILESEKSLRQFSLLVMRRQEEERKIVGGNLLDSLGQYLSVLKMKLDSMHASAEDRESRNQEELVQCLSLAEDSLKEVRTVSYLLYPPLLEEVGLRSAIPWYLDGFAKRSGIKTTFQISPGFRRLSNDVNLAIFRVLQEALTNVHCHSGSSTADIQLLTKDDCIMLIVSDAGRGIPPELLAPNKKGLSPLGMGLRGMSERLRYLGGRLEITSPGKGVTLTATIPVGGCSVKVMSA